MRLFATNQFKTLVQNSLPKALLIMNLTSAFLLAISLSANATVFSQQVSISEKNTSLEKIFKQINRQTGYTFVYTESQLKKSKKVSITVQGVSIEQVLDICFKEQALTYTIFQKLVVIKEKDDILNVGSTLYASNFSITGINEKSSGKEKTTTTAKKVDKLRISFDLNENMIAQSGNKEIFISITAPDGTPVAVEALGSGTFSTRDGQQKFYTQKLDVDYTQNKKQTVSFDWKQNTNFNTGNYKIEVFNNGFKVGEASRPLKKGGLFS